MKDKWIKASFEYAVIGDPVAHSLSPEMQNAGFVALGLGRPYGKYHVKADEISDFAQFARENLRGFNITVPHKKNIIPFLDGISRPAELAESVNTVTVRDGKLFGDSTDGFGLASALNEAFGTEINGGNFLFIGCGGAVQAVAFYFASAGAAQLCFANRTVAKVEKLAAAIADNYSCSTRYCAPNDKEQLLEFINSSTVLIQGTSLGLKADDPIPLDTALLNSDIAVYDTIYKATPLLRYAAEHGIRHADGRTMLLHQGARSFEIWTGLKAPVEKMRVALEHAMR
ncbi:MAG: shikimate dehydrogenase [Victivallaceae bacterium]|nr:shikimate dehydrogenase [Victivallaceae bacterium]